jgi:hypothetical protein
MNIFTNYGVEKMSNNFTSLAVAISLGAFAVAAQGQDQEQRADDKKSVGQSTAQLEEIVVTAR